MAVFLTREISWNVARRLHNPALSPAENARLYGASNNEHGFGHNLVLEATVAGEVDPVDGMLVNLVDLERVLRTEVHDVLDHRNLNVDVPPFDVVPPTAENLLLWIWERLAPRMPQRCRLVHLRLRVTSGFRVDLGDPALAAGA